MITDFSSYTILSTTSQIFGSPCFQLVFTSCSDYKLNLVLHSYQNPHHHLYNGHCCNSLSFTACHQHKCYNSFLFCYSLEHRNDVSLENFVLNMRPDKPSCPDGWSVYSTRLIGHWLDNTTFPAEGHWISEKEKLFNPLTVTGNGYPVSGFIRNRLIYIPCAHTLWSSCMDIKHSSSI